MLDDSENNNGFRRGYSPQRSPQFGNENYSGGGVLSTLDLDYEDHKKVVKNGSSSYLRLRVKNVVDCEDFRHKMPNLLMVRLVDTLAIMKGLKERGNSSANQALDILNRYRVGFIQGLRDENTRTKSEEILEKILDNGPQNAGDAIFGANSRNRSSGGGFFGGAGNSNRDGGGGGFFSKRGGENHGNQFLSRGMVSPFNDNNTRSGRGEPSQQSGFFGSQRDRSNSQNRQSSNFFGSNQTSCQSGGGGGMFDRGNQGRNNVFNNRQQTSQKSSNGGGFFGSSNNQSSFGQRQGGGRGFFKNNQEGQESSNMFNNNNSFNSPPQSQFNNNSNWSSHQPSQKMSNNGSINYQQQPQQFMNQPTTMMNHNHQQGGLPINQMLMSAIIPLLQNAVSNQNQAPQRKSQQRQNEAPLYLPQESAHIYAPKHPQRGSGGRRQEDFEQPDLADLIFNNHKSSRPQAQEDSWTQKYKAINEEFMSSDYPFSCQTYDNQESSLSHQDSNMSLISEKYDLLESRTQSFLNKKDKGRLFRKTKRKRSGLPALQKGTLSSLRRKEGPRDKQLSSRIASRLSRGDSLMEKKLRSQVEVDMKVFLETDIEEGFFEWTMSRAKYDLMKVSTLKRKVIETVFRHFKAPKIDLKKLVHSSDVSCEGRPASELLHITEYLSPGFVGRWLTIRVPTKIRMKSSLIKDLKSKSLGSSGWPCKDEDDQSSKLDVSRKSWKTPMPTQIRSADQSPRRLKTIHELEKSVSGSELDLILDTIEKDKADRENSSVEPESNKSSEINSYLDNLHRIHGYTISPNLAEIVESQGFEEGLRSVKDLRIKNSNGYVQFLKPVDLRPLQHIPDCIQIFENASYEVYPKTVFREDRGEGLNQPCIITLYNARDPSKYDLRTFKKLCKKLSKKTGAVNYHYDDAENVFILHLPFLDPFAE